MCEQSQCTDFINNKELCGYDESSAKSLKEAMLRNRDIIVEVNGKERFDADMETLGKLEVEEEKKGQFLSDDTDVDSRDPGLRDMELSTGFNSLCGVKGN